MFLKKRFFIFIVLIILIFGMLTYQGSRGSFDTSVFSFLNYPLKILEHGITTTINGISNLFSGDDMDRRFQNREAGIASSRCLEARYENERLRALLELKTQNEKYVTSAEVIARDPTNWSQVLWINKGTDNGISKNMLTVTPLGVVGRIYRVFNDRANIIQISDLNSSVAVRLQSSRAEGILEGTGNSKCYLKYVSHDAEVVIGDAVITSGLDGIYPEGLIVGHVTNMVKKEGDFFQVIEVLPAQNLKTIEEVAILKR